MALTIPSIFTAVDKFTAPVEKMQRAMGAFGGQAESSAARLDRRFTKISSSAQNIALKSGAMGLAMAAPLALSVNKATEYEDKLANLKALTGATGKEFDKFKESIDAVSESSGRSKLVVTDAFTAIANNMPELLKDSEGLKQVTEQSILLSKAGKMELGPTGEALTTMLNQFGKGADYAAKAVDTLAAGSVAGSSEINQTADAVQKFGTVAANLKITIPESVALVELGSKFEKGAEAGVKFRNILQDIGSATVLPKQATEVMQRAGVNMKMLVDKSIPLNEKLLEMKKILKITGGATLVFGKENSAMATGLLTNADAFKAMLEQVSKSGEANRMAGENSNTFKEQIEQSKAAMDNLMIAVGGGLIPALTDLTKAITPAIKKFGAFIKEHPGLVKMAAVFALILFAISGIASVVSIVSSGIAGIAALAPLFTMIAGALTNFIIPAFQIFWTGLVAIGELAAGALGIGFGAFMAILLAIVGIFISLYAHWDMIVKAFKDGGIIGGLKAIGATLLDVILYPLQKILEAASKLPSFLGGGLAASGAASIEGMRAQMGLTEPTPAASTKATQQEVENSRIEKTTTNKVVFDFKNVPKGMQIAGDAMGNNMMPSLSSTMGF